jgi:hypothetical protein
MLSNYLTILAGAAALTAAAPLEQRETTNYFAVTGFNYGCTGSCAFTFDVSIHGSEANHPAIDEPVTCSGAAPSDTYFDCGKISETQSIGAYIDENDQLKLAYYVNAMDGNYYSYFGQTQVYALTGPKAGLQNTSFNVDETSSTV